MNRSRFGRALLFALFAGACAPLWSMLMGWRAEDYYFSLCVLGYLSVVSTELRVGLKASALSACLCALVALTTRDTGVTTALAAVALSLSRSVVVQPRPFARALIFEIGFIGIGALAALLLFDPSALGSSTAHWAFWLVQAGFVLSADAQKAAFLEPRDAFERARIAAEAVLANGPR